MKTLERIVVNRIGDIINDFYASRCEAKTELTQTHTLDGVKTLFLTKLEQDKKKLHEVSRLIFALLSND